MHSIQLFFQREICFASSSHICFLFYTVLFKICIKCLLDFEHLICKQNASTVLKLLKFIFWKIGIFLPSFSSLSIMPAWEDITKNISLVWPQVKVYLLFLFLSASLIMRSRNSSLVTPLKILIWYSHAIVYVMSFFPVYN